MIPASKAAFTAILLWTVVSSAQNGSMFRGNPAHTGVYDSATPKGIDHVRWEFKTGGRIVSSPVVARGVVYIGSDDHFLHAIDAATGQERWKFQTEANVSSTVADANGSVYFLSLDGNAYSVDEQRGKLNWKFVTEGESRMSAASLYGLAPSLEVKADPWDFFTSSPIVDAGQVYFGSGDHNIYALDARTGQLRWKYRAGDVVHSSPAIANGMLYIGCWDGTFYALSLKTGDLVWKFTSGKDPTHFMQGIPGSAAIADGIVVFGSRDSKIYALDAVSGNLLWSVENDGSWVISSPAALGGTAYVTTSDTKKFRAIDLKTGKALYDVPFKAYSFSSPAIAGRHAYFGTFDGCLHDVDLDAQRLNGEFCVRAAQAHKELLTSDGHLNENVIYGPLGPDGKPNNTLDATIVGIDRLLQLGSVLASPAIANGIVYAASADGSVYALD
jgi:outer membrane protein assembly factor BamB